MLGERANPVHWDWLVLLEMFVAGVAGGAYVAAVILEVSGRGRSPAARTAHLLAFPLMALATLLLIVDLARPERFWHMAVMNERFLPMLKPWSPMSLGTWLVILFTLFAFVSFVDALIARRLFTIGGWRYDRTLHGTPLGLAWSLVGGLLGLAVGIYSGVLLTVGNFPGWGQTWMIPAVYVSTAMITGVAAVVLIQALVGPTDADVVSLADANVWLIAWWLVNVVVFLLTLVGGGAAIFLRGVPLIAILVAIVLAGIVPLVLYALRPISLKGNLVLSAVLVLVGGFLMRYGIVMGPQLH
ncbi:MAG: polysulfide reductase NrfD [Chloroflexi bacterium]|nr:polysulfide reductase NrfD [Chloroflexota bacterium]